MASELTRLHDRERLSYSEMAIFYRTNAQSRVFEKELIRLQQQWADAVVNQDGGVMDRILADDFVVTGPTGSGKSTSDAPSGPWRAVQ